MMRSIGQPQKFSLPGLMLLLSLLMGCASIIDSDTDDSSREDKNFSGAWKISEELNGCNDNLTIDYTAEIIQEGTAAQLHIGDNVITCSVDGDELLCSGILQSDSDTYRDFDEILLKYEVDDQLQGTGAWTAYTQENNSCTGISVFSIKQLSPDATQNFRGDWDIREDWQGCNKSGAFDYTISIKPRGAEASLFIGNRSLDCTLNENELNCTGERFYDNGTHDHFSQYTLWFNEDGRLEGEGNWTYYGTGENQCSGSSVFSMRDPDSDDAGDVNFEGVYQFYLNIDDCQGYRPAEQTETYVIFQNGTNATFESISDPTFSFDCRIIRGELQCEGKVVALADSNAVWEISELTFSHDSRDSLTGVASGITFEEDNSECPGTYYFSTISSVSAPTASFSGTWNVNELLLGCKTSINTNYSVEIIETGDNATIDVQGEVFDCTIDRDELICAGAFHGSSGAHFDYSEYRLWFNENNLLDGIARWTLYEGANAVCSGNSTIAATPVVDNPVSLMRTPGMSMGKYLLGDSLK